jgi:hypothetical protein
VSDFSIDVSFEAIDEASERIERLRSRVFDRLHYLTRCKRTRTQTFRAWLLNTP